MSRNMRKLMVHLGSSWNTFSASQVRSVPRVDPMEDCVSKEDHVSRRHVVQTDHKACKTSAGSSSRRRGIYHDVPVMQQATCVSDSWLHLSSGDLPGDLLVSRRAGGHTKPWVNFTSFIFGWQAMMPLRSQCVQSHSTAV